MQYSLKEIVTVKLLEILLPSHPIHSRSVVLFTLSATENLLLEFLHNKNSTLKNFNEKWWHNFNNNNILLWLSESKTQLPFVIVCWWSESRNFGVMPQENEESQMPKQKTIYSEHARFGNKVAIISSGLRNRAVSIFSFYFAILSVSLLYLYGFPLNIELSNFSFVRLFTKKGTMWCDPANFTKAKCVSLPRKSESACCSAYVGSHRYRSQKIVLKCQRNDISNHDLKLIEYKGTRTDLIILAVATSVL